jgi:hypothetical protein
MTIENMIIAQEIFVGDGKKLKSEFISYLPAQDRVFHIFRRRIMMANKCDISPANLNTFILSIY